MADIKEHLIRSCRDLGEPKAVEEARSAARLRGVPPVDMQSFATHPHRGTGHPDLPGSVRHVTEAEFVFYFTVDDGSGEVEILAVFFGGKEHLRLYAERAAEH